MPKVAREVVESAGLDVDKLIEKLVAAAGAEFTTFYYYTILRVCSIGHEGEGLKEIIEDARIEDRNHFEALFPRKSLKTPASRTATTSRPFSRGSTNWAASFPEISVRSLTLLAAPMPICPTAWWKDSLRSIDERPAQCAGGG